MNEALESNVAVRLFCSFRTQGRLYGIDAAQVREVSTQVACTPVPQSPPAVRGLANLRSRIYLIVDIRPILGFAPVETTSESRLIVLKPHLAEDLGIMVEHGGDILHVPANQIEATLQPDVGAGELSHGRLAVVTVGVCKLESELMTIIDPIRLVETVKALMQ